MNSAIILSVSVVSVIIGFVSIIVFKKKNMKIQQTAAVSESVSVMPVHYAETKIEFGDSSENSENTTADNNMAVLERIGCFLSVANDEKTSPKCRPTSLQDVDPRDFA